VLGTRRLHALGSFLFGSVGQAVTSASSCPVVVVRGGGTALLGSVSHGVLHRAACAVAVVPLGNRARDAV
jgi:nucleotide-binding universal stress UspA family protein